MNAHTRNILFSFCLLLGRFPLWVLLLGFIFYRPISFGAFLCFGFAAVLARGYLIAYESGRSLTKGTFVSAWRYLLRPLGILIFIEISYFSLIFLFLHGGKTDWGIFFAMFACFILSFASGIFIKKQPETENMQTLVPRSGLLKTAVVFLWFYILLNPDGIIFMTVSILLIYMLEFISTFNFKRNEQINNIIVN